MSIKRNYPVLSRMAHFYCSAPPPPSLSRPERILGNKWTDSVGNPGWLLLTRSRVNRSSPSPVPPQTPFEPAAQIRGTTGPRDACVFSPASAHITCSSCSPSLRRPSRTLVHHRLSMCCNICGRGATLTVTVRMWNFLTKKKNIS